MAETATAVAQPAKLSPKLYNLPAGQAFIAGRVAYRRKVNTQEGSFFITVLKLPAPDAFSHPITTEVRSRDSIGSPGDDWSGTVRIAGYPRSYDSKPDADGEIKRIHTAQNILEVIEA